MPTTQDKLTARRETALATPSDLGPEAVKHISGALNVLLADVFTLYLKTKNFHWHMSGPHFRDYHLLLDEHGDQIFAMTDSIAERVRKLGGLTIRSIGHVARLHASATTMRSTWTRSTWSPNCAKTTVACLPVCAKLMTCATKIATSLPQAC
jgi:DNA-binding ferritin-like protein